DSIDLVKSDDTTLARELTHEAWSRREAAHQETLRRGPEVAANVLRRLEASTPNKPAVQPRVAHRAWLAAAAAPPAGLTDGIDALERQIAAGGEDAVQLLRAARTLPRATLLKALSSADPRVAHAAVVKLFDPTVGDLPDELVTGPARSSDTYVRQAAVLVLAERATLARLRELCQAADAKTRLAGALACGFRLTLPPATGSLAKHLPLDKLREESAYVVELVDGKFDLRSLGPIGNFTTADHWKAGGHTDEQEALFGLLLKQLNDQDESVRLTAAQFLLTLNDPRSEPAVAKVFAANDDKLLGIARPITVQEAWIVGPFDNGDAGLKAVHAPERGAVDPSAKFTVGGKQLSWTKAKHERTFVFTKLLAPAVNSSYYTYFRLESSKRQRAELALGSDDGVMVWQNGQVVWTNDTVRSPLPFSDVVKITLEPGSNDFLIKVNNVSGDSALLTHFRALTDVAFRLPEPISGASLAERLKQSATDGATFKLDPAFLSVDWNEALKKADVERGRKLFSADGLGCAKCHALTADSAGGSGPSLAAAAKRFTVPYMVESVLLPSKTISPVFKSTTIETTGGKLLTGLIVGETGDKVELLMSDTKKVTIAKSEIESRKPSDVSTMPQGVVKTPDELRDILAYILSQ
ncbi:MAG TPA: c-type cytochrome, partial [Pirellulaceae bacterium]|nr:c-type cytochrome [Pirellulaceae bacterium]